MKTAPVQTGVLPWAVEKGSSNYVPIRYVASGPLGDDDARVITWITGFGEKLPAAAVAASTLARRAGCVAIGIDLPFAGVVRKSSNTLNGLYRLVSDAPHEVARRLAPERAVYMGGDSRGGGVAAVAAGSGPVEALGALSPLSVTNQHSSGSLLTRQMELAWRLGVRTGMQQDFREPGTWRTFGGAFVELSQMASKLRLGEAMGFALSGELGETARGAIADLHKTQDKPVRIFAAEQDTCFLHAEYQTLLEQSIGAACCDTVLSVVPGPHSGMESRTGQRQLEMVADWFAAPPSDTCH
jgi:alpha-beta hydrolase superfamily lysophospholipase